MRQNQQTKGQNSYYYAHTRSFEVPKDAKVVEGPGLITGGPPVLLETKAPASKGPVVVPIRNYTWNEDDLLMKVAFDGDGAELANEENTTCDFKADTLTVVVRLSETKELRLNVLLKKTVDPEKCKVRFSKGKGVRLTLAKTEKGKWYDLVSKKA